MESHLQLVNRFVKMGEVRRKPRVNMTQGHKRETPYASMLTTYADNDEGKTTR